MALTAGELTSRVRVERQAAGSDDGYGNVVQPWASLGTVWAKIRPQFGRERLEAGRLESTSLAVITLRRSSFSIGITAADRLVVTAGPYSGRTYQIRSVVPTMDSSAVEMTIEEGVAT